VLLITSEVTSIIVFSGLFSDQIVAEIRKVNSLKPLMVLLVVLKRFKKHFQPKLSVFLAQDGHGSVEIRITLSL
jgi:hypothetical protein